MSLSICERFDLDPGEPTEAPLAVADPETYAYQEGKAAGRKEAIADVLRFLRAGHAKFDKASRDKTLSEDGRDRCSTRAALLETMIAYIERGDHEKQP